MHRNNNPRIPKIGDTNGVPYVPASQFISNLRAMQYTSISQTQPKPSVWVFCIRRKKLPFLQKKKKTYKVPPLHTPRKRTKTRSLYVLGNTFQANKRDQGVPRSNELQVISIYQLCTPTMKNEPQMCEGCTRRAILPCYMHSSTLANATDSR